MVQAKDIPDEHLMEIVRRLSNGFPRAYIHSSGIETFNADYASRFDIESVWSGIPPKVIQAKLKSLVKRGLLSGCTCGCRGDFEVTDKLN